jgi:hypothetical protein
MKKEILVLSLLIILMISCKHEIESCVQYKDGFQLLSVNSLTKTGKHLDSVVVYTIAPDTAKFGEEFHAKVFLSNPNLKIVEAYFDCNTSNSSLADTVANDIIGCRNKFVIENDTVSIYFQPGGEHGQKEFREITILSVDNDHVYRFHKGTFKYYIPEN